ncbi:hypothetical protein ACFQL1_10655 [Halomicroarcula sp. GCM10025709]|uniref:hypothetical protein n=1 Tax=Haloarcula TaxID=2237 RepID=UPI0024C28548|nr:hypothetical protein [Halomicroarcula sp. YJ-61-S]
MQARDTSVATPAAAESQRQSANARYELEIALLRQRITQLESAVEAERQRRQAVVDRYERLLEQR